MHDAPVARVPEAVQVPLRVKSAEAVPVSVSALNVSVAAPLLVTVTVRVALVVPWVWEPKANVEALNEIAGCGAAVPVPLSVTVDCDPEALCVMLKVPARAPVAAGVKVISTVQEALTATVPPAAQVEAPVLWKSAA